MSNNNRGMRKGFVSPCFQLNHDQSQLFMHSAWNCSTADLWPRKAWSTHFPGCKLYCFWTWYTFLQSASMDLRVGTTKDYLSIHLWGTSWLHCCRAFHWFRRSRSKLLMKSYISWFLSSLAFFEYKIFLLQSLLMKNVLNSTKKQFSLSHIKGKYRSVEFYLRKHSSLQVHWI